jgi:hypothetical protein
MGLSKIERRIEQDTEIVEDIEEYLGDYHKVNDLPTLHLSVITPDTENRKTESKAISYPHIRCVAVYDIQGKKNRLSVFVGRLDEFQEGINSPLVLTISREKVFNHLIKTFPNSYSNDDSDKVKKTKTIFMLHYQHVDNVNVTIGKYKKELELKIARKVGTHQQINVIQNELLLPQINLTSVFPDVSKIQDTNHTISIPHLRCMVTYNIAGTKKRLNIYIGRLEDFPFGVDDEKAITIAREKTFIHLQKNFPSLYC